MKINNLKNKGENKKKYRGKIKDPNALSNLFPQFKKLEGREYNREKIRIRDKHTCQICGKNWEDGQRRFDVHHIDCIKEKTRQYDTLKEWDNLITLCHKCHLNLPEHKKTMKNAKK